MAAGGSQIQLQRPVLPGIEPQLFAGLGQTLQLGSNSLSPAPQQRLKLRITDNQDAPHPPLVQQYLHLYQKLIKAKILARSAGEGTDLATGLPEATFEG